MNDPSPDQRPNDPAATEQAYAWFIKLQSAEVSAADRAEFERWLARDERHRRAYAEAQRLWRDQRLAMALRKTRPSRVVARSPVGFMRSPSLVFALLLTCFAVYRLDPVIRWQADHWTAVGERRTVQLADGSRLILAPDSAVAVALGDTRQVRLLKGEVYCEVQPDAAHPFVVLGHNSRTQVLGTRFSVHSTDSADILTVAHGKVDFSRPGHSEESRVLHADEQSSADADALGGIVTVPARQALAWTHGTLVLEQTPLAEAVERIRPYHTGLLLLRDESLRDYPVSGRFDLNDLGRLLDTLAQTLPIRVTHITPWVVVLSRRKG